MKVELRNVKWSKAHSRETPCYTADVYIDGVKMGDVHNSGTGGCDMVSPPTLTDLIDVYAKSLPPRRDTAGGAPRPRTWENVVSDAFERWDARRDFDRKIARNVLFLEDCKIRIVRARRGSTAADVARAAVAHEAEGRCVLNLMPPEEAFAIFWGVVAPVGSL